MIGDASGDDGSDDVEPGVSNDVPFVGLPDERRFEPPEVVVEL
jgi:hypothetical protein